MGKAIQAASSQIFWAIIWKVVRALWEWDNVTWLNPNLLTIWKLIHNRWKIRFFSDCSLLLFGLTFPWKGFESLTTNISRSANVWLKKCDLGYCRLSEWKELTLLIKVKGTELYRFIENSGRYQLIWKVCFGEDEGKYNGVTNHG